MRSCLYHTDTVDDDHGKKVASCNAVDEMNLLLHEHTCVRAARNQSPKYLCVVTVDSHCSTVSEVNQEIGYCKSESPKSFPGLANRKSCVCAPPEMIRFRSLCLRQQAKRRGPCVPRTHNHTRNNSVWALFALSEDFARYRQPPGIPAQRVIMRYIYSNEELKVCSQLSAGVFAIGFAPPRACSYRL
jgi:hypothetical protein